MDLRQKRGILFILLSILIILLVAKAYSLNPDELIQSGEKLEEGIETVNYIADDISSGKSSDYLKFEWKKRLSNIKFFYYMNALLEKLNFIWIIILGMKYEFSFVFLFAFFWWLILMRYFYDIFQFSTFYDKAIIFSFLLNVIGAQLGFFVFLSEITSKFFSSIISDYGYWIFLIALVLFSFVLRLFDAFFVYLKMLKEEQKKREEQEQEEFNRKFLDHVRRYWETFFNVLGKED